MEGEQGFEHIIEYIIKVWLYPRLNSNGFISCVVPGRLAAISKFSCYKVQFAPDWRIAV